MKFETLMSYEKIILIILSLLLLASCAIRKNNNMPAYKNIRRPAVAGTFYPGEASRLNFNVKKYLEDAASSPVKTASEGNAFKNVRAIMVPHAGYDYSGPVAAYGFRSWQGKKAGTVVIIGNSHQAYFTGVAIDANDAWETPLGLLEVDKELAEKLARVDPMIKINSDAHKNEHSLEVQLPFLQVALEKGFKILPILFGNTRDKDDYKKLAKTLADNLGDNDLAVISSDMSHYPSYADANQIDPGTLEKVASLDVSGLERHINEVESKRIANEDTLLCGIDAVKTGMELAKLKGWKANEVKYANSGDAEIGDKEKVVGYGVVVFTAGKKDGEAELEKKSTAVAEQGNNGFSDEQKNELLRVARETVENYVKNRKVPEFKVGDEKLNQKMGAFVTLNINDSLRGCIGQILPTNKPLWQVVRDMAVEACSGDPRFNPVSASELSELEYEISVLSVSEKINDWRKIELGKHGVIVSDGINSGVFLPQVATETGWSLEEFLAHLCSEKAGLASSCYKSPDVELKVFTATIIKE